MSRILGALGLAAGLLGYSFCYAEEKKSSPREECIQEFTRAIKAKTHTITFRDGKTQEVTIPSIDEFCRSLPPNKVTGCATALKNMVMNTSCDLGSEESSQVCLEGAQSGRSLEELCNATAESRQLCQDLLYSDGGLRDAYLKQCEGGKREEKQRELRKENEDYLNGKKFASICIAYSDSLQERQGCLRKYRKVLSKYGQEACRTLDKIKDPSANECWNTFTLAVEARTSQYLAGKTIAETRDVEINEQTGNLLPFFLTRKENVSKSAPVVDGVAIYEQTIRIKKLDPAQQLTLRIGKTNFSRVEYSIIGVPTDLTNDHYVLKLRAETERWPSGRLSKFFLEDIYIHDGQDSSLEPLQIRDIVVEPGEQRNLREYLRVLFSMDFAGLVKSTASSTPGNRTVLRGKVEYDPFFTRTEKVSAHLLLQGRLERNGTNLGSEAIGEVIVGGGSDLARNFRRSPWGIDFGVGYNFHFEEPFLYWEINGEELFNRNIDYQLRYNGFFDVPPQIAHVIEANTEGFLDKKMELGWIMNTTFDRTRLREAFMGFKFRIPLLESKKVFRYLTNLDLGVGYHYLALDKNYDTILAGERSHGFLFRIAAER